MHRTGICEQTSQTPTQEFQVAKLKHCFPRSLSSFHYSEEHHQGMLGWLIQLKINEVKMHSLFPKSGKYNCTCHIHLVAKYNILRKVPSNS